MRSYYYFMIFHYLNLKRSHKDLLVRWVSLLKMRLLLDLTRLRPQRDSIKKSVLRSHEIQKKIIAYGCTIQNFKYNLIKLFKRLVTAVTVFAPRPRFKGENGRLGMSLIDECDLIAISDKLVLFRNKR